MTFRSLFQRKNLLVEEYYVNHSTLEGAVSKACDRLVEEVLGIPGFSGRLTYISDLSGSKSDDFRFINDLRADHRLPSVKLLSIPRGVTMVLGSFSPVTGGYSIMFIAWISDPGKLRLLLIIRVVIYLRYKTLNLLRLL